MKPIARATFSVPALVVVALLAAGCSKKDRAPSAEAAPAAAMVSKAPPADGRTAAAADVPAGRKALLEVHAQIEMELTDAARAHTLGVELSDFARGKGGYVADSRDEAGSTHMVLRVPAADLKAARSLLAGEGKIARESEQAVDVTDAVADLDARLRSARIEEARILKIIDEKSGSITDVLAAERALADVRQRVERLEADQRLAQGRVDLATLEVTLRYAPAYVPPSEPSVGARLSEAASDGVTGAKVVTLGLVTTALRGGPTLILFAAIVGAILLAVRRLRKVARSV